MMGLSVPGAPKIPVVVEVILKQPVWTDPPVGKYRVNNLFVDPETGKLEVEYEDTPVE
jgi:hypothetical protein